MCGVSKPERQRLLDKTKKQTRKDMKTIKNLSRFILALGLSLAVIGILSAPTAAQAQEKGATRLLPLKTVEDLQKVEAGDTVIATCPKCKDSYAAVATESYKGMNVDQLKTKAIHLCPTCETKIVTAGEGKAATNSLVHTCNMCGSTEVTCCVLKKNVAASAPDSTSDSTGHMHHH